MNDFPYYYDKALSDPANKKVNKDIIHYAGMYLLKRIDTAQHEGTHAFAIPLQGLDEHLEPVFDDLQFQGLITINTEQACYALTPKGDRFLEDLIQEIEDYIDQFQAYEASMRIHLMLQKGIDVFRVRFLWGLYDGEFDDLEDWFLDESTEKDLAWQHIITSKEFYEDLFEEIRESGFDEHTHNVFMNGNTPHKPQNNDSQPSSEN